MLVTRTSIQNGLNNTIQSVFRQRCRYSGGKASTIKSHHNLIPFPDGVSFELIEPLDHFSKDEVRARLSCVRWRAATR